MKSLTFKRGIHPKDEKARTCDQPIKVISSEKGTNMIYPMAQHIGAPCVPTVKVGDEVFVGQKIGESQHFISAPIHSTVSGIVKEIGIYFTPNGVKVNSVVVENDGLDTDHESISPNTDYESLTKEQIIEIVKEAGIVGLGGAGFPTYVKLSPPKEKKIEYVLVNAAECEPFLTNDHRIMLEESEKLKKGLQIILKLFPEAKGIIAIEGNKMNAIEKMTSVCGDDPRIEVVMLKPKYPQGAEKQLIKACVDREVPSGGLPADVGVVVNNVDTVVAIHRAVTEGRPLMRRILTMTGDAIKNPGNYEVKLGMTYSYLVEKIGGFKGTPYKLISGGPMMGVAMFDLDVPIVKTSSSLICLSEEAAKLPEEQNCIRCGKCVSHCPIGLMPVDLSYYAKVEDWENFEKYHGLDCIECGSCSYICPAKRHMAQYIRAAKQVVLGNKRR